MKTFIYHKDSHTLKEKATITEPVRPVFANADTINWRSYDQKMFEYIQHLNSLLEYPCAPSTMWEEGKEYIEGKDFEIRKTWYLNADRNIPTQSDLIDMAHPNCTHEAIIDTGVGYMHCPACGYAEKYDEKTELRNFTLQEAIQIARDAFSQGLNNYYHPDVLKKMTEDEFLKHYFKTKFNIDL